MNNMTGEEILQAIHAAKNTLDKNDIKRNITFQIAADHNVRRKITMIDAAMELYEYLHGNGKKPSLDASSAFNPNEGKDKTNIYYIFKELYQGMPWEIRRDNPISKRISETHSHARKVAAKICGKDASPSFFAQQKALEIWNEYRNSIEVKSKYCAKHHRITYADVFTHCKRALVDLGFSTVSAFEKAVKSAQKNRSRAARIS